IVVLLHGYGAPALAARAEYRVIAARLANGLGLAAAETAIVGLRWASSPGPVASWLPRMVEHRLLRPVGLARLVRDPYATVVWRAHGSGRRGLREALFRLEDAFPGRPIHLVTHSLGADLAL